MGPNWVGLPISEMAPRDHPRGAKSNEHAAEEAASQLDTVAII